MRLRLTVVADDIDIESGRLWAAGALGIEELPTDDGHVALIATFPGTPPTTTFPDAESLPDVPTPTARPYASPSRVGRFVTAPPWAPDDDSQTAPGDVNLSIDPGEAFGHGAHVTTRLMLQGLDRLDVAGRAVGDIGCGTGVVAIAAAALGASPVVAIDIDPAALAATRRNAQANGMAQVIEVIEGDAAVLDRLVDIALVNVTVDVHERIGSIVAEHTVETIVVGGILENQVDRAIAAYRGLGVRGRFAEGEWRAVELGRADSGR